jgi:hypothetical protein
MKTTPETSVLKSLQKIIEKRILLNKIKNH